MPQQPVVTLTNEERATLETFVHRGKANARTLTRARILLKSADGWSTAALAATFDVCQATVTNVRGRFAQGGLEAVLHDKAQQHRRSALSGLQTAHLIAVACSPLPDSHDHWTVRLLAQQAVALGFVTSISPNTIHESLKKPNSNSGSTNCHLSGKIYCLSDNLPRCQALSTKQFSHIISFSRSLADSGMGFNQ